MCSCADRVVIRAVGRRACRSNRLRRSRIGAIVSAARDDVAVISSQGLSRRRQLLLSFLLLLFLLELVPLKGQRGAPNCGGSAIRRLHHQEISPLDRGAGHI